MITTDEQSRNGTTILKTRTVSCSEDVACNFPELICEGKYPPPTAAIEVLFELRYVSVVRKKPHSQSQEKKFWLKQELQGMLDSGIIRPSASPITIVPKEDGSLRFARTTD